MRFRFCRVTGDTGLARLLERVYDGLDGGIRDRPWITHENLWQLYSPGKRTFECGPSWGLDYDTRTDSPGLFVGLTGWLPFLEPFLCAAYRNTWMSICRKQRADGMFPIYPRHGEYKTEQGVTVEWGLHKYKVDDYIDGHLAAVINGCEDILFTRDAAFGRNRLPKLRKAMTLATGREFSGGLMHVGYGGAFIELWYSFAGYPSSTQIFHIRALRMMAELERFLGHPGNAEEWESQVGATDKALKRLITREGFFINAIDDDGRRHGDGRDYFESIPNVLAAPLEVIDESQARKIVEKIKTIPQLDENTPMAVNYPGRTESFHPRVERRGLGAHWNGGAWMGFGGFEAWTHLIARDYDKAERLMRQMVDIRDEYGLQDFVAGFGAHKGANVFNRRPRDHPITFQMGAFGNPLRGLLGIQPRHDRIELTPRIFPGLREIRFLQPIYYGGREILVAIRNGKAISSVSVNGDRVRDFNDETVRLKADALPRGRCLVEIDC